jgi:hypothetical protein
MQFKEEITMLNFNANANFDGCSVLEDGTTIANFNASLNAEGNAYVSVSVHDRALYAANKDMVDADFAAFVAKLNAPAEVEA